MVAWVMTPEHAARVHDEIRDSGDLPLWTVYESPSDFPGLFVARPFSARTSTALSIALIAPTLDLLRARLPPGLTCLPRSPEDDPVIVEVWL